MKKYILLMIGMILLICSNAFGVQMIHLAGMGGAVGYDCDTTFTYLSMWTGDYTSDTDKLCYSSGTEIKDGTESGSGEFGLAYGDQGCKSEYDLCQNFEDTGYDNFETWSETGTVDEDNTTRVLRGNESLYMSNDSTSATSPTFTAHTDGSSTYVHLKIQIDATSSSDQPILRIRDDASSASTLEWDNGTENLQLKHGTVNTISSGSISYDTTYHLWIRWVTENGTNVDGIYQMWQGTTGDFESAELVINESNGDGDYPGIDNILFRTANGLDYWVDQVIVSNSPIGDVDDGDGSQGWKYTADGDNLNWDVSSDDIFNDTVGTIWIKTKIEDTTISSTFAFVEAWYVTNWTNDRILIKIEADEDIQGAYEGNNNTQYAIETTYALDGKWAWIGYTWDDTNNVHATAWKNADDNADWGTAIKEEYAALTSWTSGVTDLILGADSFFGQSVDIYFDEMIVMAGYREPHPDWAPIEDGGVAGAWLMIGSALEADVSANDNGLTETSGTIPTSSTVPAGYSGTSRDFTAADTENLTHADALSTDISGADQEISMCVWVNMDTDTGADQVIFNKWTASAQQQYSMYYDDTANAFNFELSSTGSNSTIAISSTGQSLDTWQHWCATYNDIEMIVYLNGAEDTNGADNPKAYTSGIFNSTSAFYIGGNSTSTPWDGLIDEPIIFDRALSAAEVKYIYDNGITGDKGASDVDTTNNDFSGNSDVKVYYLFEGDHTDEIGSADLTNSGQEFDTTGAKEGYIYVVNVKADNDHSYLSDGDCPAGFPGKNGVGEVDLTAWAWFNADTTTSGMQILGKRDSPNDGWYMQLDADGNVELVIEENASSQTKSHASVAADDTWYFGVIRVQASDNAYKIDLFDTNCFSVGSQATGSFTVTSEISGVAVNFSIGTDGTGTTLEFDGFIDGVGVAAEYMSDADVLNICRDNYGN